MPVSAFNKYQDFAEQLGKKNHNLNTDTFKVAFTNTAPVPGTHTALADITQLSTGGGYTGGAGGGITLSGTGYSETGGVGSFVATDAVFTATGGSVGPFRYAVLYNDSTTSPADALIGYWDYGSAITLADGESLTLDFGSSIFTLT